MIDREKVIKGLETCSAGKEHTPNDRDCTSCPYYPAGYTGCTCKPLMTDALALLKAQEPRVMTREEALNSLVIEYRNGNLKEVGERVFTSGLEYYGSIWRVWDRMPTDEQRRAVKWEWKIYRKKA